ncbi:MAG: CoA ester lyase [Anaerolineae bacterium]|nr:CoA ester lyase [Anaerolineae bacterium]
MSTTVTRVRRAMLFTPGDDMKKLAKAAASGADSVILDLEDGVAVNRKQEARATIVEALKTLDFGRSERLIRINAVGSGLEADDMTQTLPAHPDGYVIPKVEHPEQIAWVAERIAPFDRYESWESGSIRLLALIETALGVVNLKAIATADRRLDALIFGAEDLVGSLGAVRTREGWEVFYARSAVVTHAAAYDLQAIDTVYVDFKDMDGLKTDAEQAVKMGFSGKLAIHPNQIEPITQVFIPSDATIAHAQRLMAAFVLNQANGTGVFDFDGKMVDMPMIRAAERVIQRAQAAGKISS